MTRKSLAASALLAVPLLAPLAGCTFGPHQTSEDREAVADCKQESDRIFATRNRDELSERDTQDTPFSGNALPYNPVHGLQDQYQRDELLDTCLARSAAGGAVLPDTAPGPVPDTAPGPVPNTALGPVPNTAPGPATPSPATKDTP
jgi:hypothetical protein